MMRILVTGVTGQVGSALLPRLAKLGTVVEADRTILDLSRVDTIPGAVDTFAPDVIVNSAAYTAVDRAEDEPDRAFLINAAAPEAIARWAALRQIPLIHFSTDYVFDGTGSRPWQEQDRTGPLSVYGASKLAGEQAILSAGGPHLIIRTSWVYASRGKNFLQTIARLARERKELRIVSDQVGAPTPAAVIANAVTRIFLSSRHDFAGEFARASGVVHLATAGHTSWHGFATTLVAGLRKRQVPLAVETITPITTADFPTRARRPANSRLDLSRLQSVFGVTMPPWDVGLQPELDILGRELRGSLGSGI